MTAEQREWALLRTSDIFRDLELGRIDLIDAVQMVLACISINMISRAEARYIIKKLAKFKVK